MKQGGGLCIAILRSCASVTVCLGPVVCVHVGSISLPLERQATSSRKSTTAQQRSSSIAKAQVLYRLTRSTISRQKMTSSISVTPPTTVHRINILDHGELRGDNVIKTQRAWMAVHWCAVGGATIRTRQPSQNAAIASFTGAVLSSAKPVSGLLIFTHANNAVLLGVWGWGHEICGKQCNIEKTVLKDQSGPKTSTQLQTVDL